MSSTINLIKKTCKKLGYKYEEIDSSGMFVSILIDNKNHFFIANNLGLNSEVVSKICQDKFYTYTLLKNFINMPKTTGYIDTNPPELYSNFSSFKSNDLLIKSIIKNYNFPIIVKPNSKSMGINTFKCESELQVKAAVKKIFDKNSYKYDHVLLAQQYLEIVSEYRVVIYNKKIQFLYKKDTSNAQFISNLSPLHWNNARAKLIKNHELTRIIQNFINPIFKKIDLMYAGLDVVKDKDGKLWLIEINTQPGFTYFIQDNDETEIIKMFEKILSNDK